MKTDFHFQPGHIVQINQARAAELTNGLKDGGINQLFSVRPHRILFFSSAARSDDRNDSFLTDLGSAARVID